MTKRGPSAQYVRDQNGEPIVGLYKARKTRGRLTFTQYYAKDAEDRFVYFGRDDEKAAILRFRHWLAEQTGSVKTILTLPAPGSILSELEEFSPRTVAQMSKVDLATVFRECLETDAKELADLTGYPELSNLQALARRGKGMTLEALGRLYQEKTLNRDGNVISPKQMSQVDKNFKEFCQIVEVSRLVEIGPQHITRYRDVLRHAAMKGEISQKTASNRFNNVKCVFNECETRSDDEDIPRVKALFAKCNVTIPKAKTKKDDPSPISRENLDKLLTVAPPREKAMIHLCLNCGLYPVDLARLLKTDLDLEAGMFTNNRGKTGEIQRAAKLWARTVEAVDAYLKAEPHANPELFVDSKGRRWGQGNDIRGSKALSKVFNRLRKRATIAKTETSKGNPHEVVVSDLRDGTASYGNGDQTARNILLGHSMPGVDDAYVSREPDRTANYLQALEAYYFPAPPKKTAQPKDSQQEPES